MSEIDEAASDPLTLLMRVRHHCFIRGIVGRNPDPDYRLAFRTLNRLYVEQRDGALKARRIVSKRPQERRRRAA